MTTDADVMFTPESVEALLDILVSHREVGAVCSRTFPMGSGPVYWYQIFDYAIGHWLIKVSNNKLIIMKTKIVLNVINSAMYTCWDSKYILSLQI